MSHVLGGVCDLSSKTRGGQYFVAEGREIEGPSPPRMFLAASLMKEKEYNDTNVFKMEKIEKLKVNFKLRLGVFSTVIPIY